ncbi:peptidylprolyl isomerase [Pasteurellaceae bacterium LIM206]|nr:peptidylprolyl isomerase [Pasteurellaceae bacterium LIM206]
MKLSNLKFIAVAMVGFLALATQSQAVEQVVATVNGTPILASQVKRAMGKQADTVENRGKALDSIIDDMLLKKAIKDANVHVSPAQVDKILEDIAAQNHITYGQLLDALDQQGIGVARFRANIAQQIMMAEVRNRSMQMIGQNIEVNPEEIDALATKMFDEARQQGRSSQVVGTQYDVRHILVKLNPLMNDAQAKALLTQVRADILAGKTTFAQAALAYSKDYLSGANGGDLGFAFADAYVPEFAETIKNTKQGTISAPFKTQFGWHILEVVGTRKGDLTAASYRQKAYETLANRQLQSDANNWVRALRKGADIKYFVK